MWSLWERCIIINSWCVFIHRSYIFTKFPHLHVLCYSLLTQYNSFVFVWIDMCCIYSNVHEGLCEEVHVYLCVCACVCLCACPCTLCVCVHACIQRPDFDVSVSSIVHHPICWDKVTHLNPEPAACPGMSCVFFLDPDYKLPAKHVCCLCGFWDLNSGIQVCPKTESFSQSWHNPS